MKQLWSEFKTFIARGNVMNLAVGVIVGGAFQSVVSSLTGDIISPIIGLFTRQDFSQLELTLPFTDASIRYGAFLTAILNFLIMALVVFLLVRFMNALLERGKKEPEAAAEPTTRTCPFCYTEISKQASRCPNCTSQIESV